MVTGALRERSATDVRGLATVLVLGGLMVVLDTTITIVAIPRIVRDLGSTLPTVQWITSGYVLALVAILPTAAWAMRRFGTKRVYLVALAVFTLASALAGLAWSVGALIAFRALQGLGGGLLNPVGQAIALHAVPRGQRGRMMSLLGLPVVIGPVLGPPLSGLLVDTTSWRWIFIINVPIGIVAMALAALIIPARRTPDPATRLDWTGLALLPTGAVLVVLALTFVGNTGQLSAPTAAVLVIGLALGAAFVVRSLGISQPLVDLRLLRSRTLSVGCATLFCFGAAYFGAISIPSVFVQGVRGDTAFLAGFLGIPQGLATGITLQVATRSVDRFDPRRIVVFGITTTLAGMVLLMAVISTNAPYPALIAAGTLLGLGSGATIMPTMTATLRDLSVAATPGGVSLMGLIQQLASSVGAAAVAALLTISLSTRVPELNGGGLGQMIALNGTARAALSTDLAAATGFAYLAPLMLIAVALLAAFLGLRSDEVDSDERTTR